MLRGDPFLYMKCPGKKGKLCSNTIPRRLICKGSSVPAHEGLEYTRCDSCNYFTWLAPDVEAKWNQAALDQLLWPTIPSNDIAVFAAFDDSSVDPELLSQSWQPSASLGPPPPSLPWNYTSTVPPPSSQLPNLSSTVSTSSAGPYSTDSGSSQLPSSSQKTVCAQAGCRKTQVPGDCSSRMCKSCCMSRAIGCTYRDHRNTKLVPVNSSNPMAPSRPAPIFPPSQQLVASSSSVPSSGEIVLSTPREFKKPMGSVWEKEWDMNARALARKRADEDLRKHSERSWTRNVRVTYWSEDDEPPTTICEQDIGTWPFFRLAQSPTMLESLEINLNDPLDLFNFGGWNWELINVNHVINVEEHRRILVRRRGVTTCGQIDEFIDLALKEASAGMNGGGNQSGKRKASTPAHSTRTVQAPRLSELQTAASSSSSTYERSVSTPTSASSHFLSTPASSPPPSSPRSPPPEPEIIDLTISAAFARASAWPDGIYAADMARGINIVANSNEKLLKDKFAAAFPGVKFVKETWHKQRKAWTWSEQGERDAAVALPRDSQGLWNDWRARSSGWRKVKDHERGNKRKVL